MGGSGVGGRGRGESARRSNEKCPSASSRIVRCANGGGISWRVAGTLLVSAVGIEMAIKETPSVFFGLCRGKFAAEVK